MLRQMKVILSKKDPNVSPVSDSDLSDTFTILTPKIQLHLDITFNATGSIISSLSQGDKSRLVADCLGDKAASQKIITS